ncbi:hypothetical protein LTR97_007778 [Elasticomyces elasticus]|uniref:Uncharacterized protein n=1 Tax=Elasticomyces elasticus TaxID=574655 RepID=A0AAN7W8I2_9PEZI|nr:hypothetical protein LTR97_007778 [Elasticomyces elasticus]
MPDDRRTALRALLVNQRVNKTFAAVVRTSPDLRVALFFDHEKHDRQGRFEYRPFANTLLQFLDCYSPMDHLHTAIEWNHSQDEFPNLLRVYRNVEKVRDNEVSKTELARAQAEASSWKRMLLLSQPVKVAITTIMPNGDDLEDVVLEAGTSAGMLFGTSCYVPVRSVTFEMRRASSSPVVKHEEACPLSDITSAVTRVFATPELLELILLKTLYITTHYQSVRGHAIECYQHDEQRIRDLRALLVNQRVSKVFAAAVEQTPSLREALFFTHEKPDHRGRFRRPTVVNTLMPQCDYYSLSYKEHIRVWWGTNRDSGRVTLGLRMFNGQLPRAATAKIAKRWDYGSWKKMVLISQPVEVKSMVSMPNKRTIEETLKVGTTLGQLLKGYFPLLSTSTRIP